MSIDRRSAIRNILMAAAGTVCYPSLSAARVADFFIKGKLTLGEDHEKHLAEISETFLPVKGVSEKTRKPQIFIQKMLNHTLPAKEIEQFAKGFDEYIRLMADSRLAVQSTEAAKVIPLLKTTLSNENVSKELAFFINTTRSLSIRCFTTSEYYVSEHLQYRLIPGPYQGCTKIEATK